MSDKHNEPPTFKVGDDFYAWKKDVELWQIVTKLAVEQQGAALYLKLVGEAKEYCQSLEVDDLKKNTGVELVVNKIKELYGRDKHVLTFQALENFETFMRDSSTTDIHGFINEFDNRYYKVKTHCRMEYPNEALAYKLLKACNLSDDDARLARATTELDFKKMKDHLRSVFGTNLCRETSGLAIKVEPTHEQSSAFYSANGSQNKRNWPRNQKQGSSSSYNSDFSQKNLNPLNKYGKPYKCHHCKAITHMADVCPDFHRANERNVNVTLFSKSIGNQYMKTLCDESLNCAILDTGCASTVCGKAWLDNYVETLKVNNTIQSDDDMVCSDSNKSFRFGSGNDVPSLGCVKLPATIGNKSLYINTDIVDGDLPLLLSKNAMKTAETKLDFSSDSVNMLGENVKLKFASSGHYMIPLLPNAEASTPDVLLSISKENGDNKEALKKLHVQFGHAADSKLIALLKDAGYDDKKLFDSVKETTANCDTCKRYKREKSRPVVGFSLGKEMNDVVSMDLKTISGKQVLHLIDNATRYSQAVVVPSKKKECIAEKIFMHWICIFGTPKRMLFDNGGEFCNQLIEELAELFNTEILTTAGESPWSNGITERHNAIIGAMVEKVMCDVKCSIHVALAWSVAAKNALQNVYGFSPNQLVFGRNPNFPVATESELPALSSETASKLLADHLNALYAAREAFVHTESSQKIKRALLKQTRTSNVHMYTPGTQVYYKRSDNRKWKGPGIVLGSFNKQVLVKHGSFFYRVSPCHLRPTADCNNKDGTLFTSKKNTITSTSSVPVNEDIENDEKVSSDDNDGSSSEDDSRIEPTEATVQSQISSEQETTPSPSSSVTAGTNDDPVSQISDRTTSSVSLPTIGSKVKYIAKDDDTNEVRTAHVISRAGKASGGNRFWFNVKDDQELHPKSMNFKSLKHWEQCPEEVLLTSALDSVDVLHAKQKEIENLQEHNVYEEVVDQGQPYINVTWVLSEKVKDGKKITKARLVAKGFEEEWKIGQRKDSPTCLKENLRLILSLAAMYCWKIYCLDIRSAFLQGKDIERELFLKPPVEAGLENVLWLLKKTIYGLMDAGRKWYLKVKEVLLCLNVQMSIYDESLFYLFQNGCLQGVIGIHVDDFFFAGTSLFYNTVIKKLHGIFKISKEEEMHFNYLGLELKQFCDHITLTQNSYIQEIKTIVYDRSLKKDATLPKTLFESLRSLIGQLSWVANHSRPDISFEVCQLSVNLKQATVNDVNRANKCVKTLRKENVCLKFPQLANINKCSLVSYSDASFANLPGCSSQGGSIVFLCDESGKGVPLSWHSKKLKRVVKSTTGAETMALLDGVEDCLLMQRVLSELFNGKVVPVVAKVDCKNLHDSVYSSKTVEDKRLKIDLCTIRDYLRLGELSEVCLVNTKEQLADTLTKSGADPARLKEAIQGRLHI